MKIFLYLVNKFNYKMLGFQVTTTTKKLRQSKIAKVTIVPIPLEKIIP